MNFAIPEQTNVVLKVYDLLGREAAVLVNGNLNAGYYTVDFNGTNYTSGVYIFKLETSNFTALKKMVLVK
ncbi:MAG: T9SS C-terminal target domain-containing protein [Ignavibacteriae bacterium]|nr:MAG: T9SS C-terminal target domain-containing protein [Ignavibacteriota bacterium]